MVANLRAEKGHDTLLAAAPRILRYPDASFTFVGDGPRREALETPTRALGVTERVRFVGERRDVASILARHDRSCPVALGGLPALTRPWPRGCRDRRGRHPRGRPVWRERAALPPDVGASPMPCSR
jgi:hypothetical protein